MSAGQLPHQRLPTPSLTGPPWNAVSLVGRVLEPPKVLVRDGTGFARLYVASHRRAETGDPEGTEDLDWHLVLAYGELAVGSADLERGDAVRVHGHLRTGLLRTSAGVVHRSAIRATAIERDPPGVELPPLVQRQTVQTLLLDLSMPFE